MDERLLLSGGDQERRLPIFKEIQDSIIDPLTFNLFFYDGKIKSGGEMGNLLESLIDLLKKDERFVSEGNLLKKMVIESAIKLDSDLLKLLLSEEKMKEKAFLSYKVDIKAFDDNAKDFDNLSIDNQKKFLCECLDKNHLYVNYSEIDDEEYRVKEEDKKMNKEFYKS